jgi:hypothetical protein
MKMDKDTVIKHKFWFLLGLFALLWIIGISVLGLTAGEPIRKKRADYEAKMKGVKEAHSKGEKNERFLTPWQGHQKLFQDHKDTIWAQAWELQKDMYVWPGSDTAPLDRKITDPSVPMELPERQEYRRALYQNQLRELANEVTHKPEPRETKAPLCLYPVELKGGFDAIMTPVTWNEIPNREEIWLAQEDFWVKKDLLRVVRAVLDSVGRMELKGQELKRQDPKVRDIPPGTELSRHRFANDSWELTLVVEQGNQRREKLVGPQSTIKNIHPGHRTLPLASVYTQKGLQFRVKQRGYEALLTITGEPLPWDKTANFKGTQNLGQIDFTQPFTVEEDFDWFDAPVRRIDALQLAWPSSRTVTAGVKSNDRLPQDLPEAAPAGGQQPAGSQTGSTGANQPAAQAGAVAVPTTANNGLNRLRYLQVTPQCRHLPIGMVLVVDQANVPDVLAAVTNSRLRIQVTQVQINHVRNVRQPAPGKEQTGNAASANPMNPMNPMGSGLAAVAPRGGAGSRVPTEEMGQTRPTGSAPQPGMVPGGTQTPAPTPGSADDPNLVEVALYGIAALYERFDPSKVGGAGQPGAPAPGPAGR